MNLTLDIKPEILADLARKAAAQGRTIEAVAAALHEAAVHLPAATPPVSEAKNLFELFAPVRGLLTDEEIDRCFSRNPSPGRPVDLS
jgi:hypothetical protein